MRRLINRFLNGCAVGFGICIVCFVIFAPPLWFMTYCIETAAHGGSKWYFLLSFVGVATWITGVGVFVSGIPQKIWDYMERRIEAISS